MAFTLLALLTAAAAELSLVLLIRAVVDQGLSAGALRPSSPVFWLVAVLGAIYSGAWFCRVYLISWLGERVVADARIELFGHVVRLGPHFFDTTKTSEVISRLVVDTSVLQALLVGTAPSVLHSAVLLLGCAVFMAIHSPKLALIVLLLLPACALPAMRLGRRMRALSKIAQDRLGKVGAEANETLRALPTVQAFSREESDRARVAAGVEEAFRAARRRFATEALVAALVAVLVLAVVVTVVVVGVAEVAAGRMTAGDLTAFLLYTVIGAAGFAQLSGSWSQAQRASGALERVTEVLRVEPVVKAPSEPLRLPDPGRGEIVFDDVTFRYPSRPAVVALDSFSLKVNAGETVAIVGPSGAGKTTVFNLLLRFYDPDQGRILFDGVDIAQVDPHEVRSRMALVSQSPDLFSTSVAQNILYGDPAAGEKEILEAATEASALEFIESLPDGFATYLGESGVRLSGGQRQRLAIARAILRRSACVLLFDEATAALDSKSEDRIQRALTRAVAGKTALVIAHRLATARRADRIVVMDRGRIAAAGTHDELLQSCDLYRKLAQLQLGAPAGGARYNQRLGITRIPGWEGEIGRGVEIAPPREWDEYEL